MFMDLATSIGTKIIRAIEETGDLHLLEVMGATGVMVEEDPISRMITMDLAWEG